MPVFNTIYLYKFYTWLSPRGQHSLKIYNNFIKQQSTSFYINSINNYITIFESNEIWLKIHNHPSETKIIFFKLFLSTGNFLIYSPRKMYYYYFHYIL